VGVSRDCPIFLVPLIISGTGKAKNFKFCAHIHRIARSKSPLKISGKITVGAYSRTLENFQGMHLYIGASRGYLWDSSAVCLVFLAFADAKMEVFNCVDIRSRDC